MNTDVMEMRSASEQKSSRVEPTGWLMLSRRALESFLLAKAGDPESQVRVTLLNTQPVTLELDLPDVGVVQICLHAHNRGVKFGVHAPRSVQILRGELGSS